MSIHKTLAYHFKLLAVVRVHFTMAAILISLLSHAQTTISPMLFSANAHDTSLVSPEGASYSVSWSLGEIAIETIANGSGNQQFIITQGYHQPSYGEALSAEDEWNHEADWADISVYPNPSPGEVKIAISQNQNAEIKMQVYSLQGQLMLRKYYHGDKISDSVNLSHLRSATYLIMFTKSGHALHPKTFKLIKTH